MEKENLVGLMVNDIQVGISTTRNVDWGLLFGQMGENTWVSGWMAICMVVAFYF